MSIAKVELREGAVMKSGSIVIPCIVGIAALVAGMYLIPTGAPDSQNGEITSQQSPEELEEIKKPEIPPEGPYAKVHIDQRMHNFGVMAVNSEQSHTFIISNKGEVPLELVKGATTCKCTKFDVKEGGIPPGETAEVELSWVASNVTEGFQQTATIYSNDPDMAEFKIGIQGKVEAYLTLQPEAPWDLGDLQHTTTKKVSGAIFTGIYDKFSISDIKIEDPTITAEVSPLSEEDLKGLEAKAGYRVDVTVSPIEIKDAETFSKEYQVGKFEEEIHLTTDLEKQGNLVIKLSGIRHGPVRFRPAPGYVWFNKSSQLDMGTTPAGQGKDVDLYMNVYDLNGLDLKIKEITINPKLITVTHEIVKDVSTPDFRRYKLTFHVPENHPAVGRGPKNPGKVLIKTNHPNPLAKKFSINLTFQLK